MRLYGTVGEPIAASVSIIPEEKYPFTITGINAKEGDNIRFEFLKRSKGPGYILNIENRSNKKGRYFDKVVLKTDSEVKQEIVIKVYGKISEKRENRNKVR